MITPVVGIIGDGQLGQMLFQAAIGMGFYPRVYGAGKQSSCRFIANRAIGDLYDEQALFDFGQSCDIITIEVEHISTHALARLEEHGVNTYPSASTLALIANKSTQKQFFVDKSIPTAPFWTCDDDAIMYPAIAKTHVGGYDGNGVRTVSSWAEGQQAFGKKAFFVEQKLDIAQEISVILARNSFGEVVFYPLVAMQFANGKHVLKYFESPAEISNTIAQQAREVAHTIATSLDYVGVMAVECIITPDDRLYVNEIAPRVHNSGHHTQFACLTSQFEQHWRAILGLPFGSSELLKPAAAMNILATDDQTQDAMRMQTACADSLVQMHLYHKQSPAPYRKMGHITALGNSLEEARFRVHSVEQQLSKR